MPANSTMSASVIVRPGDSYSSPASMSSKKRRTGGVTRASYRAELAPDDGRPRRERGQLAAHHVARQHHHPAVRAREDALGRDVLHHRADVGGYLLRRLDGARGNVDGAREHVLVAEQLEELERHPRVRAFERDLADPALREQRDRAIVLPPLAAQRLLPVDVR